MLEHGTFTVVKATHAHAHTHTGCVVCHMVLPLARMPRAHAVTVAVGDSDYKRSPCALARAQQFKYTCTHTETHTRAIQRVQMICRLIAVFSF